MPEAYNIETIFREFRNKVYRLALSITRNEKDAEDVLQNTFVKIIKNLAYFKNKSQLSTWIYRITYNESLMQLRKRRGQIRIRQAKQDMHVNWSKLPDEELLDGEIKQRVDDSIKHLPIQYRMPLILNNLEGLSLKQSARILNLKINSLKTRLRRARLIIKQEMTDYFKDRQERKDQQAKRCGIWANFVYDYADGRLGKVRNKAFNRHIEDCEGCRQFLDTYDKAIQVTHALECRDMPQELINKIETFLPRKNLNIKKREAHMFKTITRDELMKMVSSGENFKLVDVLDKDHFVKEHIKGAISIPVNEIDKKALKSLKKNETIVVYCASFDCQASTNAAQKLISLGYENVFDYKGGLKDYKEANLPLEGSLHEAEHPAANTCCCC